MKNKINIALFSPNKNPYSETFIQAHKNYLKGNVFYYYGENENIELENYPSLAGKYKIYFLKAIKNILKKESSFVLVQLLKKSLKKHQIDVVLVEYGMHAQQILPAIEKCNLPLVVHFHGYDACKRELLKKNNNYREVFQYASKVIVVSTVMKNQLLSIGCPQEKLVYNANAAQSKFLKVQPSFKSNQFISVGRFTNKKAPYYTILAFKEVLKKYPNAKLLMCGDGLLLEVCKNLVKYHQLENQIEFLGVISSNKLIELFEESIGYIQHSITASNGDMEGMPISILEASASGLPVVSTHHAGISDVIEDGVTGLLCKEHDVKSMGQNILKLLDDIEMAKKMGQEGKKRIKAHFSFEKHINGIQKLLEMSLKQ
ncbi:glycosyltransferase family 4 protein [uncultured Lutibacter sp.]|uniref:glycosyltransferase family 4 protein n=1 Tax=uncultured Lutibacter sp. TaxID=437739 RepID=UPI002634D818|nr:glycosyltransferase family 4 protein [uncultured Lutibacter sp.]